MERKLRETLPEDLFGVVDPRHSGRMGAIRGKHTSPERSVRSLLHGLGFRFRLHRRDLPGRPDVVLPKHKVAIFVHGCFWHGHTDCSTGRRVPSKNPAYWRLKRARNQERHRRACKALAQAGWRVLTVWECEVMVLRSKPEQLTAWISSPSLRARPERRPRSSRRSAT